jgi:phosphomannomutase
MGKDLDMIRAKDFHVAMDCCGGAGSPIDYVFLDYLYARVDRIGETPGEFPREIEPSPANLQGLCERLAESNTPYDAVFVTDCDNDRCVLIARDLESSQYQPLEEDYTFAIAVDEVLANSSPGRTVVTNWSTSQMIKDICSMHHANLRRVPTGEVYTSSDAMYFHATLAGEGSCAGVIDPRVGMGRDVLVAVWHVLAALARKGQDLMAITKTFPKYEKSSRDHRIESARTQVQSILDQLQVFYASRADLAFMSREDGLIVAFHDSSRIQIRASNTEPLLRIRSWSQKSGKAGALADEAVTFIQDRSH